MIFLFFMMEEYRIIMLDITTDRRKINNQSPIALMRELYKGYSSQNKPKSQSDTNIHHLKTSSMEKFTKCLNKISSTLTERNNESLNSNIAKNN